MQNSDPDCWKTWFESSRRVLEEQTMPHSFPLIWVCPWASVSLSTPIVISTYWKLTSSLFSYFTSIHPLTLWGSRSCYFLHSSDEGHKSRDVRSLVWCHKPGGPEWLSFSEVAIIGCEELALLTSVVSIEKKVQAYYSFNFIIQSGKHSTSEVTGRQRQEGHVSESTLTRQRNCLNN